MHALYGDMHEPLASIQEPGSHAYACRWDPGFLSATKTPDHMHDHSSHKTI